MESIVCNIAGATPQAPAPHKNMFMGGSNDCQLPEVHSADQTHLN